MTQATTLHFKMEYPDFRLFGNMAGFWLAFFGRSASPAEMHSLFRVFDSDYG